MADSKKTFHKRPSFSAPTPPAKKANDLVENQDDEIVDSGQEVPVTEAVVETPPTSPEPAPSPSPKTVTKSHHTSTDSALESVLTETAQEHQHEDIPAPTRSPQVTATRIRKNNPREGGSPMNFLLVVITLFSLIFGVSGWAMYFKQAGALDLPLTQQGAEATPTPGSEDMAQATPTPEPMPVNLEVLNGSGVSGAAASTATKLQALGYTVVRTGNADASNYETSQIILNEDFTESEALLTKLEAEFGSAEKSEDALTGSTASARIIVGKDWTE